VRVGARALLMASLVGDEWTSLVKAQIPLIAPIPVPAERHVVAGALLDTQSNLEMCALILALYQNQWEATNRNWSIRERPDILATLSVFPVVLFAQPQTGVELLIALARQDRVEQERESRQALGAVLRAESEEDDAALADIRFDHRRAAADEFIAENPAAHQRALRFGVTRDRAGARRIGDLEGRAVFKPRDRFFLHTEGERT
jgi:hypothetical protein